MTVEQENILREIVCGAYAILPVPVRDPVLLRVELLLDSARGVLGRGSERIV